MKKSALFFVIFFVGFFGAFSQVRVEYNETRKLLTEEGVFPSKTDYPDIRLPKFDFTTLREKSVKLDPNIPFQFGKAFDMDLSLDDGKWYESPGGKVWKLRITSDNSYSLNLVFSKLNLGEGARMYIYNDQRNMLVGPFDNNNTKINEVLITDLIKGSSITVELYEPEMSSNSELVISKVIHGFIDTFSVGFGQSANCNIDVDCPVGQPFGLESNSVSRILINNGQSFCSGALINNTCNDFTPFLLTANHCLVGNPGDFVFRFQYRSPSPQCDGQGGGGDSQVNIFYNGSQLAANNADTDFGLLLMNNRPDHANVSFLGWSRNSVGIPNTAGIHHPRGDLMKISIDNNAPQIFPGNFLQTPVNTHWEVDFDLGTVEGGSSGSPLLDQNRRVIGQLHGGTVFDMFGNPIDRCDVRNGFYGRFDISWTGGGTNATRLSNWLDPNNTGAMTTNTINLPSIAGPDLLCSPGTYTLQNLPAGSTATWSVIPASQFVNGSGTGTSAFMELSGNYTGIRAPRIVFTISTDCGNFQVDKTFWIGPPQLTYHPPGIDPCTANPYYSTISLPGFTYHWSVDNPNVWLTSNGQSITSVLSYNPEYFNITLEISDGNCTTSRTISSYTAGYYCQCFSDPDCGNELALKVYPNPAAEMITVEMDTANVSSIDRGFDQYELKLYTTLGEELLSQPVSSAKTLLDVRSLKNGFYYIHLIHKEGILRRQIRIER